MKHAITTFAVLLGAILLVLGGGVAPAMAQDGATLPAPGQPIVRHGANPGELIVSWDAVPEAGFYRIAWASSEDIATQRSQGGNEWDAVRIVGVENRGQTAYAVNNLETGVAHYFRVGSSDTRFGEADWSPWAGPLTVGVSADCGGDARLELYRVAGMNDLRSDYTPPPWVRISANPDECAPTPSAYRDRITRSIPSETARFSDAGPVIRPGNRFIDPLSASPRSLERLRMTQYGRVGINQSTLPNASNLNRLSVGSNSLNGETLAPIGNPMGTQDVRPWKNRFTGIAPDWSGYPSNLIQPRLSDHRLRGGIPSELSRLSRSEPWQFSNNLWGGAIPPVRSGAPNLRMLNLGNSQLSVGVPARLNNMGWMSPSPSARPGF